MSPPNAMTSTMTTPKMTATATTAAAMLAAAALSIACGPPAHISAYTPKDRAAPNPYADVRANEPATNGSLYSQASLGGSLFADARAFRINDVVVVRVEEVADAEHDANTDLARKSDTKPILSAVPIIGPLIPTSATVNLTADAGSDQSFSGSGATGRKERLVATVSAIVKQVMPSGNLFIEGHRVILVNSEEHHLYVSGLVRPIDIDQENSVKSSLIAEAHIEFVGSGDVSEQQQQGWFAQIWRYVWPF